MTTSTALAPNRPANGGLPARRAVLRWAWRLLKREWRQQLLVLALITVAVAATTVGIGVAANTPLSSYVGFGSATDMAIFPGAGATETAAVARWHAHFGAVQVIENETLTVPGSITTFDLRAQSPTGRFGAPLLSLVSGRFPDTAHQVALTTGVASSLNLAVGDTWSEGGVVRRVVGIVENPEDLLDQFALVVPGQVSTPTQVIVLFDASGVSPSTLGDGVVSRQSVSSGNVLNPETITIALATITLLLIALVAVAGFTVLAQRRLRSIGMLAALGATDRHLRSMVRANGAMVGLAGAVFGFAIGFAAWLAYRPRLETGAHHVVGAFELPWIVIGAAMVFAVVAAYVAATRPARDVARMSIVAALSGRPPTPRRLRRSVVPGLVSVVIAFFLLGAAGASGGRGGGILELVLGFVLLVASIVLLAPFLLAALGRLARRGPLASRMALRDLARYRARSGASLGAISLGVFLAVIVMVASAARFGNVLDYAGPNLSTTQIIIYTPNGPYGPGGPGNAGVVSSVTASDVVAMDRSAHAIAAALGTRDVVELEATSATLVHAAAGRAYSGPLYVATPELLRAFHISTSSFSPTADVLTMRPGFAAISRMRIVYGDYYSGGASRHSANPWPCPASNCLAHPVIDQVASLPSGTSAPNTVITEYAVHRLGLTPIVSGWLVQTAHPLSALQITNARTTAAATDTGMYIETKSSIPTSASIIDWATLVGVVLALGILAMSIGLIRSESARDLQILTATGANGVMRRNLTAATAGALALLGAVVGTVAGYVALIGFSRTSALDGLSSLASVPWANLGLLLVAMPAGAAAAGWLLAGREPATFSRQPLD